MNERWRTRGGGEDTRVIVVEIGLVPTQDTLLRLSAHTHTPCVVDDGRKEADEKAEAVAAARRNVLHEHNEGSHAHILVRRLLALDRVLIVLVRKWRELVFAEKQLRPTRWL